MKQKIVCLMTIYLTLMIPNILFAPEYTFAGNEIFKALVKAYPKIISFVTQYDNPYEDPALKVRDTIFYWVNGRILPDSEKQNWKKYGINAYYNYPKMIPNPLEYTKSEIKDIKKRGSKSFRKYRLSPYQGFYETLYGMTKLADTNTEIIKTKFLKKQVLIHRFAYQALNAVEKDIYQLAKQDKEVAHFVNHVDTVYSFYWRKIAGSKSRSLHSYGIAIDTLDSHTKKAFYWLWRQNLNINWIEEPINVRWNPPNSVVQIFEKYGFIWGGKWAFYDTMHFEYRPELLILNGYSVKLF